MSLPEEETTPSQTPQQSIEASRSLNSIAPSGVFEKMFKMPVVKQFKQRTQPADINSENLFVKMPNTLMTADTASSIQGADFKEPTEAFITRHLKPGTDRESISSSHFYHDVAAIELSLYTNYLKDELTLEDMEATKNHMAAVNVQILRNEIVTAQQGEVLSQAGTRIIKELELGNIDPFVAESLLDLLNTQRRKLAGFSRRLFLQECDIRKMCEDAYAKTQKYIPEATHHWTIKMAFESLEKGETDFALQILTLTREITWPQETADLFWRKLRLSTFRQKAELSVDKIAEHNKLLEQISREMQKLSNLTEQDIKAKWEKLSLNNAIEDLHEDLWCLNVAEGLRITTGAVHNDMAQQSGLPSSYDYSRFDPITLWFLFGLHKKNSEEFHKYVLESEKSGYNFWVSYVKSATAQTAATDTTN